MKKPALVVKRCKPKPSSLVDQELDLSKRELSTLPAKVDLRTRIDTSLWPVWDQGEYWTCTAHAAAGVVLYHRIRLGLRPLFQPSRMFLYYCEVNDVLKAADGSMGTVKYAMDVLLKIGKCPDVWTRGVPTSSVWRYLKEHWEKEPREACYEFAGRYRMPGARFWLCRDLDHLRACLNEGNPFAICIGVFANGVGDQGPPVDPSYPLMPKSGDIEMPSRKLRGRRHLYNHAMVVMGYDDARKRFLVRNSFGTQWGRGGYGTIPYEYVLHPGLCDQGLMVKPLPVQE